MIKDDEEYKFKINIL